MNKYEITTVRCEVLQPIYNSVIDQMVSLSELAGESIVPPKDEHKLTQWQALNELKGLMETLI